MTAALLISLLAALAELAQDGAAMAPPPASAAGVVVTAPSAVVLGDWFEILATGPVSASARLGFAEAPPTVVARRSRARATITGAEISLALTCVKAGQVTLDGLLLQDGEQVWALDPIVIEVSYDDLPPERTPRVAAPLQSLTLPLPAVPTWIFLAACLAGLAAVGLWVVSQGVVRPVFVRVVPPDQLAVLALERLRARLPRSPEEVAVFVVAVSDVLRTYIEARFAVHAPARTTQEFLGEALSEPALEARRATLEHFLTLCDLVKYARFRPSPAEVAPLLDTATSFVEETR